MVGDSIQDFFVTLPYSIDTFLVFGRELIQLETS